MVLRLRKQEERAQAQQLQRWVSDTQRVPSPVLLLLCNKPFQRRPKKLRLLGNQPQDLCRIVD
jgi:hypothetical protein